MINGHEGIAEIFLDGLKSVFERYPNFSKGIYGTVFLLNFLYFWLLDEMVWWSAGIFSLFLTLIIATLFILMLHFGVKLIYRKR